MIYQKTASEIINIVICERENCVMYVAHVLIDTEHDTIQIWEAQQIFKIVGLGWEIHI